MMMMMMMMDKVEKAPVGAGCRHHQVGPIQRRTCQPENQHQAFAANVANREDSTSWDTALGVLNSQRWENAHDPRPAQTGQPQTRQADCPHPPSQSASLVVEQRFLYHGSASSSCKMLCTDMQATQCWCDPPQSQKPTKTTMKRSNLPGSARHAPGQKLRK